MTEDEYRDIVARATSGELLIGVDRAVARKFYTDIPLSKIKEETGEAPYFEKMVTWFAFFSAPLALLASFVLSVFVFRWWSAFVIPLSVIVCWIFYGLSSLPHRGMFGISTLLALSIGNLFVTPFMPPLAPWHLIAVVYSLWASRLVYCATTALFLALVLRNQRAFEYMREHLHMKEDGG